jgi:hypothetical protein
MLARSYRLSHTKNQISFQPAESIFKKELMDPNKILALLSAEKELACHSSCTALIIINADNVTFQLKEYSCKLTKMLSIKARLRL